MSKTRHNRGFSLAEVVISLAIILIVTVSAVSFSLSSVRATENAIHKTEAQSFASDIWECFKAAEDAGEFIDLVKFARGVELTEGTLDEDGNTIYTYHSEEEYFTANIAVNFHESELQTFTITITDEEDIEIISISYQKVAQHENNE